MDADELSLFKQHLVNFQSANNTVRQEAEEKLAAAKNHAPDKYVIYLIESMKAENLPNNTKILALILCRKFFTDEEYTRWEKFTPELRKLIKDEILAILVNSKDNASENQLNALFKLSELIAKIAEYERDIDE